MLLASSSKIFSSKKKSKMYVRFDPLKDTDETFVNILSRVGKCIRVNNLYLKVLESGFHIVKKIPFKNKQRNHCTRWESVLYLKMR